MSVRDPAQTEAAPADASSPAARAADRIIAARPAYVPFVQSYSAYTATVDQASALAWRVTLGAISLLVGLAIAIPAGRAWYVGWAIEARPASVRAIESVVFLQRQGVGDWVAAEARDALEEGDVVRTAINARAFIQFFDGSTALVYPNTTVTVLRSQQARFRPDRYTLVLVVQEGRVRFGVAPPPDEEANAFIQARVPGAEVHLTEGSYSVDVSRAVAQVTTRRGLATAHGLGQTAAAATGQRVRVEPGTAPIGALPARRDLMQNPVFGSPDDTGVPVDWEFRDISERDPAGTFRVEGDGAIAFSRAGSGHGETILSQNVDVDLWDFERVEVEAGVRVRSHSLSGGGWQGSEYPMMLRITFRDITGTVHSWTHGFYLQNDDGLPVKDATRVGSQEWQRYEASLLSLVPRPWRIIRVEVVASGWDYASAVNSIHLWAD